MRRRSSSLPRTRSTRPAGPAHGISLVVAMLMLAIIGLCAAAVMRSATSTGQVATNHRLLAQANRSAQVALRFCENQLTLPAESRSLAPWAVAPAPAWTRREDWTGGGPAMAYTLAARDIDAATPPRVPPQCLLEATDVPGIYTVTARGFSPDYGADATGATRVGSVVWLQATVLLDDSCGSACPASIRQRVWQQLLTPPF